MSISRVSGSGLGFWLKTPAKAHANLPRPPQDDQENILLLEKGDNTTMLKTSKNRQAGRQAGSTKHRTHWPRSFKSTLKTRKQTRVIVWLLRPTPAEQALTPATQSARQRKAGPRLVELGQGPWRRKPSKQLNQPEAQHTLQRFQTVAMVNVTATPQCGVRGSLPMSWCES